MTIFLKPTCAGDVKQRIYFEKPKVFNKRITCNSNIFFQVPFALTKRFLDSCLTG